MRVLFVGDVVAHPGKRILKNKLKSFLAENAVDACVVNAENVAAGLGINFSSAKDIFACGADCITLGNHSFSCPDYLRFADSEKKIIRPANVSYDWPGFDEYCIDLKEKGRLLVVSIMERWKETYSPTNILVDFHAETTSEKLSFGAFVDGKVSLLLGTHTHVTTADEKILPCGTGYITDVGMTGTTTGIIGMNPDASLRRMKDKLPSKYVAAEGPAELNAILADLDINNGKCLKIERIRIYE